MWRAAASLELLPIQTKTQLGDELIARIRKNDFVETGLWCLARLGARKLFYGPINQVLPASTATRWIEAAVQNRKAEDAVAAMARRTGDATRDLSASTLDAVRRAFPDLDLECRAGRSSRRDGQSLRRRTPRGSRFFRQRAATIGSGQP